MLGGDPGKHREAWEPIAGASPRRSPVALRLGLLGLGTPSERQGPGPSHSTTPPPANFHSAFCLYQLAWSMCLM